MASSCTASSWPAWSSTARSSRTSPSATPRPSPDLPTSPARRPRPLPPRHSEARDDNLPGAHRGALFCALITSHHNPTLQDIRRLIARRERGRFVAEGEDVVAAADEAGWEPVVRLKAGEDVSAEALAKISSLGSGTRELAVYEERWAAAAGPLCIALWGPGALAAPRGGGGGGERDRRTAAGALARGGVLSWGPRLGRHRPRDR